jgi:hypothetical protein
VTQNLIIFEPILDYFEDHVGFLPINFLQSLGEEILDFGHFVSLLNPNPLIGECSREVLAKSL